MHWLLVPAVILGSCVIGCYFVARHWARQRARNTLINIELEKPILKRYSHLLDRVEEENEL